MLWERSMRGVRWLGLLCAYMAVAAYGQSAEPPGDTVFALRGIVVNGVTGNPVARVLVASQDRRVGVLTDGDGRFAIDLHVPAGGGSSSTATAVDGPVAEAGFEVVGGGTGLLLTVQKPGYITPQRPKVVSLSDAAGMGDIEIKLMPGAVVNGRVSASGESSAAEVQVSLLRRQAGEDGRLKWVALVSTSTNGRGEFHFGGLDPGDYTVGTGEWRGDRPLPPAPGAITQAYPPVFYGGAAKAAGATKIHLHYGDSVQAEIQLQAATYYPVTVPVVQAGVDNGIGVRSVDSGPLGSFGLQYRPRDHAVEGSLPNGRYSLQLSMGGGDENAGAVVSLDVAGAPVRTKPVAMTPGATIAVRIHDQLTHLNQAEAEPQPTEGASDGLHGLIGMPLVQVLLQSDDLGVAAAAEMRTPGRRDELTFSGVQPGQYSVAVGARRGYVASIVAGGVDLSQSLLVVGAGATVAPIDIVLRDDSATVRGTVSPEKGHLAESNLVLFLPTDANGRFNETVAGPDGIFTMNDVVPGGYRVVAVRGERTSPVPYRDAEAMRVYDGKGTTISAGPGQTVQVEITLSDVTTEEN